jgi:hypothetical protein
MMPRLRSPRFDTSRRRALELIAGGGAEGCTGAIMLAHGFTIKQLVQLVRAGLATATTGHVVRDRRSIKIARMRITEAGRQALAEMRDDE